MSTTTFRNCVTLGKTNLGVGGGETVTVYFNTGTVEIENWMAENSRDHKLAVCVISGREDHDGAPIIEPTVFEYHHGSQE
jgi:hypothetical protein